MCSSLYANFKNLETCLCWIQMGFKTEHKKQKTTICRFMDAPKKVLRIWTNCSDYRSLCVHKDGSAEMSCRSQWEVRGRQADLEGAGFILNLAVEHGSTWLGCRFSWFIKRKILDTGSKQLFQTLGGTINFFLLSNIIAKFTKEGALSTKHLAWLELYSVSEDRQHGMFLGEHWIWILRPKKKTKKKTRNKQQKARAFQRQAFVNNYRDDDECFV